MTQEVPSLFRDSAAPSAAVDAASRAPRSVDPSASDAAKEARLLSQLLLLFSVKRQHSAVAALFPHHIESAPDGQFAFVDAGAGAGAASAAGSSAAVASHGLASSAADASIASAVVLDAQVHPATDAALASSLLRTRPSERELVQQFLLLPQTSRNKVAQSLFVVPPSLLEDFAVILQFFLRVIIESHSDSQLHHYGAVSSDGGEETKHDDQVEGCEDERDVRSVPEKTCSWAKNGDVGCVSYEPDESQPPTDAGSAAATSTTAVFTLPPGFQACLVDVYGSVHRSKCEEVWHGDHMAYRCRTCGLSDSSCMCLACFDPEDHEGHDYRVYRCSSGGCCDCGDPLAWKPEGFCKKHRKQAIDDEPDATLGALEHAVIYGLVRRVVAFSMNALREVYTFCLRPAGASAASSSFETFYPHAQTMRSLPKTGRRRSSFPSVMQVHLDRLQQCLAWLQALAVSCLPYRQIVTEVFLESLPPDFQLDGPSPHPLFETFPPRPLAILDVFLKAGVLLPVEICDTLGVLYLKLLFDQPFKQQYTCHFVDWYPYFIELYLTSSEENNDEGMRNLSRFIDRLFCQLFHSTAQLRELESASQERAKSLGLEGESVTPVVENLLVLLLGKLIGLFKNTLRVELVATRGSNEDSSTALLESVHIVDCGRNVFKKRVYARLCSDIRTLLVHPMIAGEVLLGSFDKVHDQLKLRESSVYDLLIQAYKALQQMDTQRRHVQQHIEFESQNWTFAFVVDYEMNLLLGAFLAGLPYCFQDHRTDASLSDNVPTNWAVAQALLYPLRDALLRWSTRSGSGSWRRLGTHDDNDELSVMELEDVSRFYQVPPRTNDQTPRTAKKSSFHLPLHHMFAAVFKEVSTFVELRSLDDWTRLLFDHGGHQSSYGRQWRREDVVFLYQVAEHPMRVATFAREIKAGLWVRNGNVMWQQLVHYYAKHWRYYGLHGDIFVCQLSALMLPRGSITRLLIQHQAPLVRPLLDRDSESLSRHESELLEETLRFVIQLVLSPLRYPTPSPYLSHEEWATWLLEREVKHWLSLGPFSRSELVSHLDLKLVEHIRQMPRHDWYLLEEEEIIGHVLERVGEYNDPYGRSDADGGDLNAASSLGFGMKMSGTWRLKNEFWREISPLFECFSPSESQLCEQNLKKHQLRNRVKIEEACLLPVPSLYGNIDYFVSAQQLASQILNSPSLFAVAHTVFANWLDENTGHEDKFPQDRAGEKRGTSENLVVAAMQCISVAARLLENSTDVTGENGHTAVDCELKGFQRVEYKFTETQRQDFFSQLCAEMDSDEGKASQSTSILSSLQELKNSMSLSPDTRALASSILVIAAKKSDMCREYIAAHVQEKAASAPRASTGTFSEGDQDRAPSPDKQQLARDMMRRRQQEILERMRSQQQKFLSSQASASTARSDEQDDGDSSRDRALGTKLFEEEIADECEQDGDEDEEACLSTEYEEEDEDEDDEWGFPAGHVDLELYFSHVASAVTQIHDRERKSQKKVSRRMRRRTQSRVRADSLGGADAASSPSISASSLDQDEDAEAEECALCRLPCDSPTDKDTTFGYVAMVQPTSLPHKLAVTADSSQLPQLRTTVEISDRDGNVNTTSLESACNGDAVVWTCGHAIHHACIKAYIDSLWKQQRASRNPLEANHHHGDERLLSERDLEFLCPVCRRLSNCLIPDVTPLLRLQIEDSLGSFSLRSASSFGEDRDSLEGGLNSSDGDRQSFTKWLKSAMISNTASPITHPSFARRQPGTDSEVTAILNKRVRKFCWQLKLRSVRSSLQLPLLLSGFADDELVIDAELRHVAETWGQQFSDWKLLLRSLEVEMDLTLCEQDINGKNPMGALPDRHRLQSLRLLAQTSVAAAMSMEENPRRNVNTRPNLESCVASTSEVLFGRRVLFAEDDEEIGERVSLQSVEPANVPLLSHPHLFEVFSSRLTSLLAVSASRCSGSVEDYRYTETLLSDVLFSARVVVTAQIIQALCSAALTLQLPPRDAVSPPRSPLASRQTPRSRKVITDFSDVETLSDAMQWTHLLLVRCRLLPPSSVLAAQKATWDMVAVEKTVVDQVLPLLRRIVLLIQASLPRVLDEGGSGDPCALCDALYSTGNAEFTPRATGSSRMGLRTLMRRLHLPPLRFFFRGMVFSPQQRELCQLWAAQMESKAAVLRRKHQQKQQLQQESESMVSLLVPSTNRRERRRLFIDLPKVYMEFFIKYSDKVHGQCQRCHQLPQHPAICLLCGDVVCCFSQCCESTQGGRIGECTQHAQTCAQGMGAFLLLRACTVILFLGNSRRCVWGSLYVDKNGEEDPYLRRGRTLFLAPHRLRALETLLISHGFAQNTAILANTSRRDGRRY